MRMETISKTFVFPFPVTIIIFFTIFNPVTCKFATFSQKCDGIQLRCSPEAALKCVDNVCLCSDPANMIFDQKRNQCVMLAGRNCTFDDRPEVDNCVDNADCSEVGSRSEFHCTCDPYSSYENLEGLCPNRKADGDTCTQDKECKFTFPCINGICVRGTAEYGETCGEQVHCDAWNGLSCVNNSCTCANPQTMIYDKENSDCFIFAGKSCYEDGKILGDCVTDALCDIKNHTGRCRCYPGFLQNSKGLCDATKDAGESCTDDGQCDSYEKLACIKGTCTESSASYGDSCGDDVRCDPSLGSNRFSCINNTCQCGNKMSYDKSNGKCAVPEGGSCLGNEDACGDNLHCDNNNGFICRCRDPQVYSRGADGLCNKVKGNLGENCTEANHCRGDIPLSCIDGVCSCDPNETVLDPAGDSCNKKVGIMCTYPHNKCVRNATCDDENRKCRCVDGFCQTEDGLCRVGGGGSCGGDEICSKELDCAEGKCECPFPLHQSYNLGVSLGQCVSYVRGPCLIEVNGKPRSFSCVPNAECKLLNHTGLHECLCADDYAEGPGRTCVGKYGKNCTGAGSCDALAGLQCLNGKCELMGKFGENCTGDGSCDPLDGLKCGNGKCELLGTFGQNCDGANSCDTLDGLKCWNGKCACSPFHKYDEKLKTCREEGEMGAFCDPGGGWKCVEGASCAKFRINQRGDGKGTCQ